MINLLLLVALTQQQAHEQCVYQAGVAMHSQTIRQEGESWENYQLETSKIYKKDEGYDILLNIGYMVYHLTDKEISPQDINTIFYDACISAHYAKQRQGPELES